MLFHDNFFLSDIFTVLQHKEEDQKAKIMRKKIDHYACLGETISYSFGQLIL